MKAASSIPFGALILVLLLSSPASAWQHLLWEEDFTLDPTRDPDTRPTYMIPQPGKWTWDPAVIYDGVLHLPITADGWDPMDCMPLDSYDAPLITMDMDFRAVGTTGGGPGIYFYLEVYQNPAIGHTSMAVGRIVINRLDNGTPGNPADDYQQLWYGGDNPNQQHMWEAPYLLSDNLSTGFIRVHADVDTATNRMDLTVTDLGNLSRPADAATMYYVIHDFPELVPGRFHFSPQCTASEFDYVRVELLPEPATLALLGAGVVMLLRARRGHVGRP